MKKFAIVYGCLDSPLQKRALEELSSVLLDYTFQYPACFLYEEAHELDDFRCIYIGTKNNNPYIRAVSDVVLSIPEEYSIKVDDDTVIIEGYDDAGVLYGVMDFYNKYILKHEFPNNDKYRINFFENDRLPAYKHRSAPSVRERGLWTWGHVIYDYKGYIDHMMKLKMNSIIIWNDFPPVNAAEIIDYAHSRNIKVIWGFAWLWDTDCAKVDMNAIYAEGKEIFVRYEREYAGIMGDGIYFQTFTELNRDEIGGVLIAEAAEFVNRTAALFFEKYPDMEIQFGLHATSVKNHLEFIERVDPRIRIVWEDCGSFPFAYIPSYVDSFDSTARFVEDIATLRGTDDRFGVVTKGLVKLDWSKFEHSRGSQNIGVCSGLMREDRVRRKHKIWKYIQAQWLANGEKAYEMIREMHCLNSRVCMYALVEDGMFEENIMYPVALYSEMLWDTDSSIKTLMTDVALREYVDFA